LEIKTIVNTPPGVVRIAKVTAAKIAGIRTLIKLETLYLRVVNITRIGGQHHRIGWSRWIRIYTREEMKGS